MRTSQRKGRWCRLGGGVLQPAVFGRPPHQPALAVLLHTPGGIFQAASICSVARADKLRLRDEQGNLCVFAVASANPDSSNR